MSKLMLNGIYAAIKKKTILHTSMKTKGIYDLFFFINKQIIHDDHLFIFFFSFYYCLQATHDHNQTRWKASINMRISHPQQIFTNLFPLVLKRRSQSRFKTDIVNFVYDFYNKLYSLITGFCLQFILIKKLRKNEGC